mgnify:CR=1 FL=1
MLRKVEFLVSEHGIHALLQMSVFAAVEVEGMPRSYSKDAQRMANEMMKYAKPISLRIITKLLKKTYNWMNDIQFINLLKNSNLHQLVEYFNKLTELEITEKENEFYNNSAKNNLPYV